MFRYMVHTYIHTYEKGTLAHINNIQTILTKNLSSGFLDLLDLLVQLPLRPAVWPMPFPFPTLLFHHYTYNSQFIQTYIKKYSYTNNSNIIT